MGVPPRRRPVTPEESALWRHVVRDAVPLDGRPPLPDDPPAPAAAVPDATLALAPPPDPAPRRPAPRHGPLPELSPTAAPGLDRRTDDRLRRGQMPLDGRIDLHGMTQAEAHAAVTGFLLRGQREGRRCVLVITGKGGGGGVLRQAVPRWLNEPPLRAIILALHRAQTRHGGDGALYVLLKRRRDPP